MGDDVADLASPHLIARLRICAAARRALGGALARRADVKRMCGRSKAKGQQI
jgi:hypothetical protein